VSEKPAFTTDAFLGGRLRVLQDRRGYRFSVDAVLLADFCRLAACRTAVDFGTGCGIIPLILGRRHPRLRFKAVEIQPALAELARGNVAANALEDRIEVLRADLRTLTAADLDGPVDAVVANPPYRRPKSGRVNPDGQRALARHEIALTLPQLLQAARRVLKTGGRFLTIYPAERTAELLAAMRAEGIEPKRMQTVHPRPAAAAKLVLVEGLLAARSGIVVEAPLFLHAAEGQTAAPPPAGEGSSFAFMARIDK
jgi:tRNA1Val (adenine37-N6)-methyltransferase